MNTGPASFFGLIGTFRHRNTSLHQGIIGVPKYGVKEWSRRDYSIYYLRGRHSLRTSEGQTVVWLPEIVKTLQTQLTASFIVPEADASRRPWLPSHGSWRKATGSSNCTSGYLIPK